MLLQDERADATLWRTFLVYLTCSPKPAWEMLAPREPENFEAIFNTHFRGMTAVPASTNGLLETRAQLLAWISGWLDESSRDFLRSVESEQPDFGLIGLPQAQALPGVRRKLHNLSRRSRAKREADKLELERMLAQVAERVT